MDDHEPPSSQNQNGYERNGWVRITVGVVHVKARNLNYSHICDVLKKTGNVFVPVNRKNAYYARRRLEKLMGARIASWRSEFEGQAGYLFTIGQDLEEDEDGGEASTSAPANSATPAIPKSRRARPEPDDDGGDTTVTSFS